MLTPNIGYLSQPADAQDNQLAVAQRQGGGSAGAAPPLTLSVWAVMYPASSDARKAQAAAMSSGLPIRGIG